MDVSLPPQVTPPRTLSEDARGTRARRGYGVMISNDRNQGG